jgi:cyclohexanone monooxygenase
VPPAVARRDEILDALIVGAGFAGLYALHRLRQLGLRAQVLERGDGVGGTWYWNRYPGARCDVESVQYSYQFDADLQQSWRWTEKYATQPEILRYLEHVAERFDLSRDVRFRSTVTGAEWDAGTNMWRVHVSDGATRSARRLILAVGCLSDANRPTFDGLGQFRGVIHHTGHWPHRRVDFAGQHVAVIGTGSSGIQCIPQIAREAARLTVFQRTPNYAVPAWNEPLDDATDRAIKADYAGLRARAKQRPTGYWFPHGETAALAVDDAARGRQYEIFWRLGGLKFLGAFTDLFTNAEANETAARFAREKIAARIRDAEVAATVLPRGVIGSKRLCVETNYYETFNRDNVAVVDLRSAPIERFTLQGLRAGGREFTFDAVVFATGFDAMTGSILRIELRGRDGLLLRDKWRERARNFLGLSVAGFPNLFVINAPGSPSVLSNMVQSIEQQIDWIAGCIAERRSRGDTAFEPDAMAEETWMAECDAAVARTLRATEDSWYVGANVPGKPRVFLPYAGGFPAYVCACDASAQSGYTGSFLRP